ncbi:mRNA export protein mlo3 [Leucoagaricus sp. SymC.cos]|nr:mRNA export protein mlo3 [Leucoagaricus sp. SymC.cos]
MHNGFNQSHVQRLQAAAAARLNNFHGPKRQLLGNQAVPAPAWKTNVANSAGTGGAGKGREIGSKILLSKLPVDVTPTEVEELFKKTVGPLKDMFLVYNSQGKSKGMAVVTFARPEDAAVARQKYDGKIVDGRRRIKIEVIYDGVPGLMDQPPPSATPTLLNRLGGKVGDGTTPVSSASSSPSAPALTLQQRTQLPLTVTPVPARRVRFKKGPKRLKKKHIALAGTAGGAHVKKGPISKDELDKEMEDYRAAAGT